MNPTKKMQTSSAQAFENLYLTYYPKIMGFVILFVKSKSVAEDLTHDLFSKLWEQQELLNDVEFVNAYLYKMAKNAALNWLQRKYKITCEINDGVCQIEDRASIEESYYAQEKELLIALTVERMPAQRKQVFELSRYGLLKNAQIAAKLNISEKTVEGHLTLALKEIKKAVLLLTILHSL